MKDLRLNEFSENGALRYLVSSTSAASLRKFRDSHKIGQPLHYSKRYKNYYVLIPLTHVARIKRLFDEIPTPTKEEPINLEKIIRTARMSDTKARLILTAAKPSFSKLDSENDGL